MLKENSTVWENRTKEEEVKRGIRKEAKNIIILVGNMTEPVVEKRVNSTL